ncbi:MAG: IS630 family transposase [Xenococcaceae cyanobacterium]
MNQKLPQETIKLLWRIYRHSRKYQVRQRAHCIILMEEGYSIEQLIKIFAVSRKTIYNWKNNWLNRGLVGLYNRPGTGRKRRFNSQQKEQIKQWAKNHHKNLKQVVEKVKNTWGIKTSKDTIKRGLKCLGMKWKRLRRIVAGKPDPEVYERKKKILSALKKLSDQGALDLRYLDETGFCLTPYVPYAWQDNEEIQGLESQQSKRLNVLGLLNRNNELES